MKAVLDRRQVVDALKAVVPAASKGGGLAVLTGVRIDVAPTGVDFTCSNLDLTIATTLDAPHSTKGTAVVPAALLLRIVSAMHGETVILEDHGDTKLVVSAGEGVANLRTLDADTWPKLPEPGGPTVTLDAETVDLLGRIVPMASVDKARAELSCVHIDKGRAATTDSYRLGMVEGLPSELGPALIPTDGLRAILGAEDVQVTTDGRLISFASGATTWTARLVDGTYPDYGRLLYDPPLSLVVDRDALAQAAELVGVIIGTDVNRGIRLLREGDKLHLSSTEQDVGDVLDTIPVSGTFDGGVGFNRGFLADLLEAHGPGEVTIALADALKPAVVKSGRLTALLMPVKIT